MDSVYEIKDCDLNNIYECVCTQCYSNIFHKAEIIDNSMRNKNSKMKNGDFY